MNEYEMMTVFHPRLSVDDTTAAVTGLEEQIAGNGGELLSTDVWGLRRLAYPINGVNEGTYVLMTFKMPPQGTAPLERWMRISEGILRHLLIRGIIPFEGGRSERDDRDDRDDRYDDDHDDERGGGSRDERDDDREEPRGVAADLSDDNPSDNPSDEDADTSDAVAAADPSDESED